MEDICCPCHAKGLYTFADITDISVHDTCTQKRNALTYTGDYCKAEKKIVKRRNLENTASIATMVTYFPFQSKVSVQ